MTQSLHDRKGNLREGSIAGHLVRLTLPMIWGIAVIVSFHLVDMYFISRLGTEALAAVSFTFPVTYAIFSVSLGFGIAMSSVVSRLIGEDSQTTLCRVVTHGLVLVTLVLTGVAFIGLALHDPLFRLLGAEENMMPLIGDYMKIWFAGIVMISLPLVGNSAIRAAGDAVVPAIIMTVAAVVNVILDPILIFGLFGFPRLEIQGAAIATVIANFCAMVAGLYVLARHKKFLKIEWLKDWHDFGDTCKRLLTIALPVGLTQAIGPIVNAVITALLASFSAEAVAAFGVVSRVEAFAFVIVMALSSGMAPVIGQNFGAKKYTRVFETLKLAIAFSVVWSLCVALVLAVFGKQVAQLFSDDSEVVRIALLFFWIVPVSYALRNLIYGWASAFNAMGQPKKSFIMIFIEMIVLMLPAVFIGKQFGIAGIFLAIALVQFTSGLGFHIWAWHICQKNCT